MTRNGRMMRVVMALVLGVVLLALAGTPAQAVTILDETFEGSFPSDNGWTILGSPSWDDASYRAATGSWSGYCADTTIAPPGPYAADMSARMIYGPFSLADAVSGSVTLKTWLNSESGFDYLSWTVSINGTNYYGYQDSGDRSASGWQNRSIDFTNVPTLGNICGQSQVWFRIHFSSDGSIQNEGAYVDDILIQKTTGGVDFSDVVVYYQENGVSKNITVNPGATASISHDFTAGGQIEFRINKSGIGSTLFELIEPSGATQSQTSSGSWYYFYADPQLGTYWARCAGGAWAPITVVSDTGYGEEPDLYDDGESYRSFSPTTITAVGQSFSASCDVRNGGDSASGSFAVKFYASTNTTISISDYYLGTVSMSSIADGSWANCDLSGISFPSGIPNGTYYVGWIIDANSQVAESNEGNNTAYKTGYQLVVNIPVPPPDLYDDGESYRSFSPTTITATGQSFSVSCDVRNGGSSASGSFAVKFYASTNTAITTLDYYLGTVSMSGIAAGSWANCDLSGISFPSGIPNGTYYVGWIIDANGQVAESNEGNNTAYKTGYQLVVNITILNETPVIDSDAWAAPNPITLPTNTTTVNVLAHDPDSGPSALTYTWSKVSGPGTVGFSPNGTTGSDSSTATFSEAGSYTLRVTVSDGAASVTSDVVVTVNDSSTVDLYDDGVSWHTVSPTTITATGQTFSMGLDVGRSGTAAAGAHVTKFYFSTNNIISGSDDLIGTYSSSGFSGSYQTQSISITWPPASAPPNGTYYIGAIIDAAGAVSETNEGNNVVLFSTQVMVNVSGSTPTIITSTSSLAVPEGSTATFQVRLSAQPAATTVVSVSRSSGDSSIGVTGGSSLTFTTSNWSTWQTVTLSAAEDSDTTNGSATIRCSASGLTSKYVTATESDNDTAVSYIPGGCSLSPAGTTGGPGSALATLLPYAVLALALFALRARRRRSALN